MFPSLEGSALKRDESSKVLFSFMGLLITGAAEDRKPLIALVIFTISPSGPADLQGSCSGQEQS